MKSEILLSLFALRAGKSHIRPLQSLALEEGLDELQRDVGALYKAHNLSTPSNRELSQLEDQLRSWIDSGLEIISIFDGKYPSLLREIADPPLLLFFKGKKELSETLPEMISIVGSRKASEEGIEFAHYLGKELANLGLCVVSGLALGIDGHAHKGSLLARSEIPTIAVLGNGLNKIYPATHSRLAEGIVESGGYLVSQFEPDETPFPSNFLNRNRVIAGLSIGTIVVQAAKRSGSLATARYAIESGREVFAVPGLPNYKMYEGTNNLIKQGAKLITKIDDILEEFPWIREKRSNWHENLNPEERNLLNIIHEKGEIALDNLFEKIGSYSELSMLLIVLEEKDLIRKARGNRFSISSKGLEVLKILQQV